MPQNTFLSTGIVDGQPVEAFQVSQSVDAFTAQADYRITHTGSYTLSGSLLMTGSLVNEYTGQFGTLGIGVTAPTAPTMLRIKDTSGAGDPIVLLEGESDTDSARIRFQNDDVSYDVGAYGSSGDSFMIVQDQNNTPKFPIISEKDVASYVLYLSDTKVGIDLGASAGTILAPLPKGSLQVSGSVSGSLLIAQTITASADGPDANIHGTASHAINVVTAETGSYVKFSNVDTFYSASGQANFENNIATIQSSSAHSFKFGKADAALVDSAGDAIVSGSSENQSFFGSVANNEFIRIHGVANETLLKSLGEIYLNSEGSRVVVGPSEFRVSGSTTPQIVVGPPVGNVGSNNPSSSLKHDALEFHKSNVVFVGNYDTDSQSSLRLLGGGDETSGINISSSYDIQFLFNRATKHDQFQLNTGTTAQRSMAIENFSTGSYMVEGDALSSNSPRIEYFQLSQSQTTSSPSEHVLWKWGTSISNDWTDSIVTVEVDISWTYNPNPSVGAYAKIAKSFGINGSNVSELTTTSASIVEQYHPTLDAPKFGIECDISTDTIRVEATGSTTGAGVVGGFVKVITNPLITS